VKGFVKRRPLWLQPGLNPRQVLSYVLATEAETRRFYQDAANHASSEDVRTLLTDLASTEEDHADVLVAEVKAKKESTKIG
jgi:rubrerythrin